MAVIRSPKFLRSMIDFELHTGYDITGKKSKRELAIEAEEKRKKEELRKLKEEKEKKERSDLFDTLFSASIRYIMSDYGYKSCSINIPKEQYINIKKEDLTYNNKKIKFDITLNNTETKPYFDVEIIYDGKILSYTVSGYIYADFKIFMVRDVYRWYKSTENNSSSNNYNQNYNSKNTQTNNSDIPSYHIQNKSTDSEDIKNKKRRYNILADRLKSNEDNIKKMSTKNKTLADRQEEKIILKDIELTKKKMSDIRKQHNF